MLLADGPFAETKEQIAGFDVIECADLDEAIEVAAKHPVAAGGLIEVRPVLRMNPATGAGARRPGERSSPSVPARNGAGSSPP